MSQTISSHRHRPAVALKIVPYAFDMHDGIRSQIEPTARVELAVAE